MHDMDIPGTVLAVARAGAGTNNIPVAAMSQRGVPVLNAPGANANAVKELVLAGMFVSARNITEAWDYVRNLEGTDAELSKQVEAGKKQFVGYELPTRTLGVVGLGAIGVQVANAALSLGMKVHLVDGTYELFRAFFGAPSALDSAGREVGSRERPDPGPHGPRHRRLHPVPHHDRRRGGRRPTGGRDAGARTAPVPPHPPG